ncbi:MAG: sigma-70 family RNA polymerase sigma factor [Tenericutes bacterium]|nr:sigma-70 family RNA polymerase sigma factor [Mycoplasmatota bacterium]
MKQSSLEIYNDNELIYLAREQNEIAYEILQKKYTPIILKEAKNFKNVYPNIGLELNDYILEGRFALDKAIYYFDEKYDNLFFTYAVNCIHLGLLTFIRKNKKDYCLNSALELSEEIIYKKEEHYFHHLQAKNEIEKLISKLKQIEIKILFLKLKGYSYQMISSKLDIPVKKVDNTLSKIRNIVQKNRKE